MPAMDAKRRPFNVVMLTEFANIIQVHCQNLVQSVYDIHREKQSGTWVPLVESCCHYGIMLHDFLLTIDRTEVWKSLRKCVWLLVWFLKSHPLIHETLGALHICKIYLSCILDEMSKLCSRLYEDEIYLIMLGELYNESQIYKIMED